MTNEDKFMLISLDDEKSKSVAEVLSSKTCKKIINYLAENKTASEKDLSEKLKSPINTIEYNLKKLISSGFVQKHKNFFWSKKGKKIIMYELSNKSVVISHKKSNSSIDKIKSLVPAFILTAAGAFALWAYERIISIPRGTLMQESKAYITAVPDAVPAVSSNIVTSQPIYLWFFLGALIAILIISIINWRKL